LKTRRLAASGCLVAALAFGAAACGSDSDSSGGGGGGGGGGASKTLNIYSSLPLQGASRAQTEALNQGAQLALDQHGGKAGNFKITFTKLDDSTAQSGAWTPEATQANARKVAQDENAAVYIGEFNSGASAVSIPILNEAGVPQISPANTAVGLTTNEAGAAPGEPDKYYPAQTRTYARIVPKDTIQGAALATLMKQQGCTKVFMTNDKEVYGAGLAKNIELAAKSQALDIVANDAIDKNAPNYRSLASKAKSDGADCFIFSGITANGSVQQFKDFGAALPSAKLYGPDGVAEGTFFNPKEGGIPANVAARTTITVATLSKEEYEKRNIPARRFFDAYQKAYGEKDPDPYAIFGYETMSVILDAIKRAGPKGNDREEVLKQIFATTRPDSVLGNYSIDKDGDTTLTDYGVYKVKGGKLAFSRTVEAKK
jgi:branched-chain amino acid transport system substrate-binding protein